MNQREKFVIKGLGGERKLRGTVSVRGAKNAALKAMAATVIFGGPVTLENVPDTRDVHTLSEIMTKLGASVTFSKPSTLSIDASHIKSTDIDVSLAQSMRSSIVLTGPLLARFGQVSFPMPGGCVLGERPIDLFIDGYASMGAPSDLQGEIYHIKTSDKNLRGAEITFHTPSVTTTETLMMAAVLAEGKTILKNCAKEPEIVNVSEWLVECGAKIGGAGTSTIVIEGNGGTLLSPGTYTTIPDRIEAGSFLILGALAAIDLKITDCRPDHMGAVIDLLRKAGIAVEVGADFVEVRGGSGKAVDVRTAEYPGFPTDLQAPMVVFLTQASGESSVTETIFEGRFKYVDDLIALGADITVRSDREIMVQGPTTYRGLPVGVELRAHDIRAGFAIVLAALMGTGTFTIGNIHLIDRGYEDLEGRLKSLGAEIKRF